MKIKFYNLWAKLKLEKNKIW